MTDHYLGKSSTTEIRLKQTPRSCEHHPSSVLFLTPDPSAKCCVDVFRTLRVNMDYFYAKEKTVNSLSNYGMCNK